MGEHLYNLVADMAVLSSSLVQINCLHLNNSICFIPFDFGITKNYQKCAKKINFWSLLKPASYSWVEWGPGSWSPRRFSVWILVGCRSHPQCCNDSDGRMLEHSDATETVPSKTDATSSYCYERTEKVDNWESKPRFKDTTWSESCPQTLSHHRHRQWSLLLL